VVDLRENFRIISVFEPSSLDLGTPGNDFEAFAQKCRLLVPAERALTASTSRFSAIQDLKNSEQPAGSTLDELNYYQAAHARAAECNATICIQLMTDLLALRPRVNLEYQKIKEQLLSQNFDLASVTPEQLSEKFAETWKSNIQINREKFKLSESDMMELQQGSNQLAQGLQSLKRPLVMPEVLIGDKWTEMMQRRLKQLKDLAGTFAPTPMSIGCPSCGSETSPDQIFCADCGARLDAPKTLRPQPVQRCPNLQCSQPVPIGANFCPVCGTRIRRASK